eukprot:CAMPEP_0206233416 /NCGR_PEP_ID=MMETSP0047_2-20121206/11978_1 /ASSEMBLY_ACC=CAM_ASM_000192 /TAXON_ID=195065 /ORGANISM="Chroomonas mesostigmatica_cf, Strain CCMP1168" /LENGTH=235 /DNA_ID=CAMNT_0053657299 /DNA_START=48 /DNA_END=754 /DNA_ORIENTATION=+
MKEAGLARSLGHHLRSCGRSVKSQGPDVRRDVMCVCPNDPVKLGFLKRQAASPPLLVLLRSLIGLLLEGLQIIRRLQAALAGPPPLHHLLAKRLAEVLLRHVVGVEPLSEATEAARDPPLVVVLLSKPFLSFSPLPVPILRVERAEPSRRPPRQRERAVSRQRGEADGGAGSGGHEEQEERHAQKPHSKRDWASPALEIRRGPTGEAPGDRAGWAVGHPGGEAREGGDAQGGTRP